MSDALERSPRMLGEPGRELSERETAVLAEEGIDPDVTLVGDPLRESGTAYLRMLADGLGTEEAAAALGVSQSRVRQLLAERRLYGIRPGRGWKLPAWQFRSGGVVPGLSDVLVAMSAELHPLTVQGFLTTPQPELAPEGDGGDPLAPIEWLAGGGDPGIVIALAAEL